MVRYLSYDDTMRMDLRIADVAPPFEEAYRRIGEGTSTTQARVHLVHGVRSAAPDAPLTKYLAKENASILGVIGTGRIARWAAEAAWSQRPIKTMKVFSRDPAHREEFCAYISERLGVEAIDCGSN